MEQNKMGTKAVFPLLMSMAFPPMLSMLVQSLYNIVDSVYVAQISQDAITAVSLAFPIQNFLLAVAVGTGVGMNSYISRKLGMRDIKEANNAVTHGILLAVISSIVFAIASFFVITPFFNLFTDDPVIFQMGKQYIEIIMLISFGQMVHIAIEKVFQATGKMSLPMIMQAVGCIVNIILDPIFIFTFGLGVRGAAIATVIGQLTSMSIAIYMLFAKKNEVKFDLKSFHLDFNCIKQIYAVGVPTILMNSLGSVLVMGLNSLLVTFSNMAVSLFGIYYKLQTFVFMPVSGLTQGALPIFGYNYGAQNHQRLKDTLKYALMVALLIMAVGTLLFEAAPGLLLTLFNADDEMLRIGIPALRIIALSYLPAALGMIFPTLFQGMGKGLYSFIIFMTRQLVITLPAAYLLAPVLGLTGIWIAFPIAECAAALIAFILYLKIHKTDKVFIEQTN